MKVFPSLAADVACFLLLSSAVFAQHYKQGNLQPGHGGALRIPDTSRNRTRAGKLSVKQLELRRSGGLWNGSRRLSLFCATRLMVSCIES
jgi:hypothetical protein